jgi:Spy/CpxP family protein refolding chaperone
MKKFTLTALSTTICALAATFAAPSFAQQPSTTPAPKTTPAAAPAGTNTQQQLIEQLKLTKDQQLKLAKLKQTVILKNIAVLTPTQKKQLELAQQQGKSPTLTLTVEQQNQLKAIQAAALIQQDAILTPEQKLKVQEMNKQYAVPQK